MARSLVLTLLVVAALHTGSAIKCYRCDSMSNPSCSDKIDAPVTGIEPMACPYTYIPDGNTNSSFSKMISPRMLNYTMVNSSDLFCSIVKVKGPSGEEHVLRECARSSITFDPCRSLQEFLHNQGKNLTECRICNNTDGCNGYYEAFPTTTEETTTSQHRHDHHTTTRPSTTEGHHTASGSVGCGTFACIVMHTILAVLAVILVT